MTGRGIWGTGLQRATKIQTPQPARREIVSGIFSVEEKCRYAHPERRAVKALTAIACLILSFLGDIRSFAGDADKTQPAAPTKPTLLFQAYDGDPRKTDPKDMSFQVNRRAGRGLTHFLKLGDTVPNTEFKLTKFEFKTFPNAKGDDGDISELTVVHTGTKEAIVLILGVATPIFSAR